MVVADTPEKIYGWLNNQLSVARFAGGCTFNGKQYYVDYNDPEQPLVRADIIKKEQKEKKLIEGLCFKCRGEAGYKPKYNGAHTAQLKKCTGCGLDTLILAGRHWVQNDLLP